MNDNVFMFSSCNVPCPVEKNEDERIEILIKSFLDFTGLSSILQEIAEDI